jgi:hypothetical protein
MLQLKSLMTDWGIYNLTEYIMKKILMTLAAVFCCMNFAFGQEGRNQVYRITLGNVQYAHHNEKMSAGEAVGKVLTGVLTGQTSVQATKYEEDVKNAIIKGLSAAYRFRYDDSLTPLSQDIREGSLIVDVNITNIQAKSSTHTWKDTKGKIQVSTYYTGVAEAVLALKDMKTGDVIINQTVKGQGTTSSNFSTTDQAVRDALNRLSNRVTICLNQYKPLRANIIEGSTAKKDKQKEVYIDLGSNEGAFEGLHMGVYLVKTVAGREAKSQIGKLKIEAVEGDDISRCKVQSGGKDIKAAIDEGEQLQVISIDK